MAIRFRKYSKLLGVGAACCALVLTGCDVPTPTGVYTNGFGQFQEVFHQIFGTSGKYAPPAADARSAGPNVAAVSDSISKTTPLYKDYSYYLPALEGDMKSNFDSLYAGIQNFEETISLEVPASEGDVSNLMSLLCNECPELLQLGSTWTERTNIANSVLSVTPKYLLTKKEYDSQAADLMERVGSWQQELAGRTAYDAELAIFDDIIEECTFASRGDYVQSAYGALVNGRANADGRAKALVLGLRSLGITCSVITSDTHAWVIAHIGDYDYNVDPTYDDLENNGSQLATVYTHFNVPEAAIADDPYPAGEFFTGRNGYGYPDTTHWDSNYHVRSGKWIAAGTDPSGAFGYQLEEAYRSGSGFISLRFEDNADYIAASGAYSGWLQSFISRYGVNCSLVTYDCSKDNTLAMRVTFAK